MNSKLKHLYIIVGLLISASFVFILFILAIELRDYKDSIKSEKAIPDTSIVKHIHQYDSHPNTAPTTVIIQQTPDKGKRKEAEKEPIIIGVKTKPGEVDVQKIDTSGKISEEKFPLDKGSTATITNKGVEEKKQSRAGKFLRKAGKVGLRVLEVGIGIVTIIDLATK